MWLRSLFFAKKIGLFRIISYLCADTSNSNDEMENYNSMDALGAMPGDDGVL